MRLLTIDGHILNPEQICYIDAWGYTVVDVYFAGRKKPLELDKDKFLALLRKEKLLEHEQPQPPRPRPEILPIDSATGWIRDDAQTKRDVLASLGLMAGEESDEEEPAG